MSRARRPANGQPQYRAAILRDLTRQRRLEQEQLLLQQQVIAAQQSQLRDMSAPVLRLAPSVVVVPLSGSVDAARAGEIAEALLSAVSWQPAATAIIDISGQPRIDEPIAQLLTRVGHALKLIGTRAVLTGARADLDAALVALGLEQIGVTVHPTLQDGVDDALQRRANPVHFVNPV